MALSHSPSVITSGLVLYLDAANPRSYPGSGTTWFDLSGNGNNGTLTNGPTFNSSNSGVISFDGVNDYAPFGDVLDSVFVGVSAKFTVAAWIYPTSSGNRMIISKNADSNLSENQRQWFFRYTDQFLDFGWFGDLSASSFRVIRSSMTIPLNAWIHVAATFDASIGNPDAKAAIFINGTLASYTIPFFFGSPNSIQDGTASLAVGSMASTGGLSSFQNFQGWINNIYIYNRVLSNQEIIQNFNATRGRFGI